MHTANPPGPCNESVALTACGDTSTSVPLTRSGRSSSITMRRTPESSLPAGSLHPAGPRRPNTSAGLHPLWGRPHPESLASSGFPVLPGELLRIGQSQNLLSPQGPAQPGASQRAWHEQALSMFPSLGSQVGHSAGTTERHATVPFAISLLHSLGHGKQNPAEDGA